MNSPERPHTEPTEQRSIAALSVLDCPLDGHTLIEASAGTGKTWTLCGLYLRLLLERSLNVEQILVVTFTNAATAELRDRVRRRLVQALDTLDGTATGEASDPFVPAYLERLVRDGQDTDVLRRHLHTALQGFDQAAIFTIHGFCQRALADVPFSAGMPISLELMPDDESLRLEVAQDFWRRRVAAQASPGLANHLTRRGDTPEFLAQLLKRRLGRPLSRLIQTNDLQAVAATLDAPAHAGLIALAEQVRTLWADERDAILARVNDALPRLNGTRYKKATLHTAATQWDQALSISDPLAWSDLDKLGLLTRTRLKPNKNQAPVQSHPFFELADQLLEARDRALSAMSAARSLLIAEFLETGPETLRQIKRERRVIAFDDMLSNLHQRLQAPESSGLAATLAERFPAALIDEFQDTDPLQFSIFQAIYGGRASGLFLIGDPKQAIYSFRGADLHTYLKARERVGAEYTLSDNQRSSPELIEALNQFFECNPRAFLLPGLAYQRVACGQSRRKTFVDARPAGESRAALQVWTLPHEADGTPAGLELARRSSIAACVTEIVSLLEGAEAGTVRVDERPLSAGDIAILVRGHAQAAQLREALKQVGVGSVERSQATVFQSPDAADLERVLGAILEPRREALMRGALATDLIGLDASRIDQLLTDESALQKQVAQFAEWKASWLKQGVGVLLRRLLEDVQANDRLLVRADGERRLTNLRHLAELLHEASVAHPAPDALLRWLNHRRMRNDGGETAQLRLDSDRNLVQILTIHTSKGLEFPLVFCPLLWEMKPGYRPAAKQGVEYHDAEGMPVWDLREDHAEMAEVKQQLKLESAAESLRLIYVALTRAAHRCYLVGGLHATGSSRSMKASQQSLLNWLVAGAGQSVPAWLESGVEHSEIASAWSRWAESCAPAARLVPLPEDSPPAPRLSPSGSACVLEARPAPAVLPAPWRISSYSGLIHGASTEAAAIDHDTRQPEMGLSPQEVLLPARGAAARRDELAATAPEDILRFPRGAAAGDCLHDVFERIDFTAPNTWPASIASALSRHPPGPRAGDEAQGLDRMIAGMLQDVLATPVLPGFTLSTLPRSRRLIELEFALPARGLDPRRLMALLARHGLDTPGLDFATLQGYLRGFIDLVFEHDGRFHVLDWKSNFLGSLPQDYGPEKLAAVMSEHRYHLQSLLYVLAVHRYLSRRLIGYHYETHFGESLYLFVRGVRPGWTDSSGQKAGIHRHRPPLALIEALGQLLDLDEKAA